MRMAVLLCAIPSRTAMGEHPATWPRCPANTIRPMDLSCKVSSATNPSLHVRHLLSGQNIVALLSATPLCNDTVSCRPNGAFVSRSDLAKQSNILQGTKRPWAMHGSSLRHSRAARCQPSSGSWAASATSSGLTPPPTQTSWLHPAGMLCLETSPGSAAAY